jgi:TRAP-type C4-dicarboxylate transport system substrate-binding protein
MNQAKYEALAPAQKQAMDDHCTTAWAVKLAAPWADWEAAGREKIKAEAGHEVYPITPEQLALWRKAAEPLTQAWSDGVRKTGVKDPDALLGELKAELGKYKAAY